MAFRITIVGDIGSGKSTVAKRIAELVGLEPRSTGSIQRQLAQARGMTVLELNRVAEEDATVDKEIDNYLIGLPSGDLVIESRMAWHFVPDTLKVYLYVSDAEAARRVVGAQRTEENYGLIAHATQQILARRKSEVIRFKKYYNVDIDRLLNYDLVIDTTFATVEEIAKLVITGREAGNSPTCWIDPRNLVPTHGIKDLNRARLNAIEREISGSGLDPSRPIAVLYVGHMFYLVDGHLRTMAAFNSGTRFVPAIIAASNNDPYLSGLTAHQYVKDAVSDALVYDWEEAIGFRYRDEVWKGRAATSHVEILTLPGLPGQVSQ
jgi:predicted cytidylate kinase